MIKRALDSDLAYSFVRTPSSLIAGLVTAVFLICALFAPFIAAPCVDRDRFAAVHSGH